MHRPTNDYSQRISRMNSALEGWPSPAHPRLDRAHNRWKKRWIQCSYVSSAQISDSRCCLTLTAARQYLHARRRLALRPGAKGPRDHFVNTSPKRKCRSKPQSEADKDLSTSLSCPAGG